MASCSSETTSPTSLAAFSPAYRSVRIRVEAVGPHLHDLATQNAFGTVFRFDLLLANEFLRFIRTPDVKPAAVIAGIGND